MSGPASNLRARKSNGNGDGAAPSPAKANGKGTLINAVPTAYGQAMDKKLDTHQSYEFGGPVGVGAMMIGFPLLMCK